jgi:hypothetical protein
VAETPEGERPQSSNSVPAREAETAAGLLDNPDFRAVMDRLTDNAMTTIKDSKPEDVRIRETAYLQMQAVMLLEGELRVMADQHSVNLARRGPE